MSKFKIGDKVRILFNTTNYEGRFKVGDSCIIKEFQGNEGYYVRMENDNGRAFTWHSVGKLQLVTSKHHKHHDLIIQWAKGAEIEYADYQGDWENAATPTWSWHTEYRIKPTPPKTDKERIAELEARVQELEDI